MFELSCTRSYTCNLIEIIFVSQAYSDVNKFYVTYVLNTKCLAVGVFIHDIYVCLTYIGLDMIHKLELLWY